MLFHFHIDETLLQNKLCIYSRLRDTKKAEMLFIKNNGKCTLNIEIKTERKL
jgi:hypothetical protein